MWTVLGVTHHASIRHGSRLALPTREPYQEQTFLNDYTKNSNKIINIGVGRKKPAGIGFSGPIPEMWAWATKQDRFARPFMNVHYSILKAAASSDEKSPSSTVLGRATPR
jgi:hypothetical protein